MLNEFDIIKKYFTPDLSQHPEVIQGVGDDAALWRSGATTLVTSVDTLLEGRHFFPECTPEDLAYKALAVNISDFAAMGATPRWFTLVLTLPSVDATYLQKFSDSLLTTAQHYQLALIGGDTAKGPLSVTIQIIGTLANKPLLRGGAKVGDKIYVSNDLGDAAFAVQALQQKIPVQNEMLAKLNRPKPQLALGQTLAHFAHSAIDISDGLAQDLQHILTASGVGAVIDVEKIPVSQNLIQALGKEKAQALALTGGDDYQLCFTVADKDAAQLQQLPDGVFVTCMGEIVAKPELQIMQGAKLFTGKMNGFMHFGANDPQSR